jgi:hypothetical protein
MNVMNPEIDPAHLFKIHPVVGEIPLVTRHPCGAKEEKKKIDED